MLTSCLIALGATGIAARRRNFRDRFDDGIECAVEGRPFAEIRIIAVRHERACIGMACDGQFGGHRFVGRQTRLAAVWADDGARANRRVKALNETFL